MDRGNHYETAFEAYLQEYRHGYVAVDESRRSLDGPVPIKNLDFIVFGGARLLVDVKGRRFPSGSKQKPSRVWQNWAKQDDVEGLKHWQVLCGPGYTALLVFVYEIAEAFVGQLPVDTEDVWHWRDHCYLLRAVTIDDYQRHMRVRSPKWGTVNLPSRAFADLVLPFRHYLDPALLPRSEPDLFATAELVS